jgi:acyl carrier protein
MIPAYFIRVNSIPLSSNGKVNKKLLPDPFVVKSNKTIREPKDEIESVVVRICSDVLKKEFVSLDDNFFEIGGNSLNAVRVISQIQKQLDIDLALKEIFYNPVLSDISEMVKKAISSRNPSRVMEEEINIIVPASEEELKLLSELQFDDEDDEY